MGNEGGVLLARLEHVWRLPFTTFVLIGLPAALVTGRLVARVASDEARERLLAAMSVAVVGLVCGPLVTALLLGYALVLRALVESLRTPATRMLATTAAALVLVVAPVAFIGELGDAGRQVREFTAFATNVAILRFWAWAWDRRQASSPPEPVSRYLLATFFFPTFVNGPIEPARSFGATWRAPDGADVRAGLARTAGGIAKLLVVGLALAPGWTSVLAEGPAAPAWRLWWWGALLYAWFYLSFSAWSDVAVGLGRLCGRRVQENFDRPWLATDPRDFWRRWHVSLGLWLRDYVYVPLGGNRRHRTLNVLVVFLLSAAWHVWGTLKLLGLGYFPPRAWGGFLVWGLVHALGVIVVGRRADRARTGAGLVAARVATFAFAAWAWVPFFVPASVSLGQCLRMLARMLVPVL
jgi:hypothetical protein